MAWHDWGNPPIRSTTAPSSDPSTTALIAEVDSTQLGSTSWPNGKPVKVHWIVGASTVANWRLEHALSTSISSTGARDVLGVLTPVNQSAEHVGVYMCEPGDRFRIRVA